MRPALVVCPNAAWGASGHLDVHALQEGVDHVGAFIASQGNRFLDGAERSVYPHRARLNEPRGGASRTVDARTSFLRQYYRKA